METLNEYMARREAVRAELTEDNGPDVLVEAALNPQPAAAPKRSMLLQPGCLTKRQAT